MGYIFDETNCWETATSAVGLQKRDLPYYVQQYNVII